MAWWPVAAGVGSSFPPRASLSTLPGRIATLAETQLRAARRAGTAAGPLSKASSMATASADMGLIGLAVMGENLVLNMESKGYTVAVHNRTVARVDAFLAARAKGKRIIGCHS